MTREEKMKKAAVIAVAYYVEQEKAALLAERTTKVRAGWMQASKTIQMNLQRMFQHRTTISRPRTTFKSVDPYVSI